MAPYATDGDLGRDRIDGVVDGPELAPERRVVLGSDVHRAPSLGRIRGPIALEDGAQLREAAGAGWPDAADRHRKRRGDVLIAVVRLVRDRAQEHLAALREAGHSAPELALPSRRRAGAPRATHRRQHARLVHLVVGRQLAPAGAQRPQALAASGRGEPAGQAVRVADTVEALHQPQPHRLGGVRGGGVVEPEPADHRPHEPGVAVDEQLARRPRRPGWPARRARRRCGASRGASRSSRSARLHGIARRPASMIDSARRYDDAEIGHRLRRVAGRARDRCGRGREMPCSHGQRGDRAGHLRRRERRAAPLREALEAVVVEVTGGSVSGR